MIKSLPDRLDDGTMKALEAVAATPVTDPPAFEDDHFDRCMTVMMTTLRHRNADEKTGKVFIETYRRLLRVYPRDAISYMSEQAIKSEDWFPTVKRCCQLCEEWVPPTRQLLTIKQSASNRVNQEHNRRFDETLKALEKRSLSQERIDALPLRVKQIAAEKCYLRDLGDGKFVVRPDIDAGRFMPAEQAQTEFTDFVPPNLQSARR